MARAAFVVIAALASAGYQPAQSGNPVDKTHDVPGNPLAKISSWRAATNTVTPLARC